MRAVAGGDGGLALRRATAAGSHHPQRPPWPSLRRLPRWRRSVRPPWPPRPAPRPPAAAPVRGAGAGGSGGGGIGGGSGGAAAAALWDLGGGVRKAASRLPWGGWSLSSLRASGGREAARRGPLLLRLRPRRLPKKESWLRPCSKGRLMYRQLPAPERWAGKPSPSPPSWCARLRNVDLFITQWKRSCTEGKV